MRAMWRCVIAGAFLLIGEPATSAEPNDFALVDESYGYHRDRTSYDTEKDVIVTLAEDVDFGPFWVAFQCGSKAVWYMNKYNGTWKDQDALPDDMVNFHDTLCALRGTLPYLSF